MSEKHGEKLEELTKEKEGISAELSQKNTDLSGLGQKFEILQVKFEGLQASEESLKELVGDCIKKFMFFRLFYFLSKFPNPNPTNYKQSPLPIQQQNV